MIIVSLLRTALSMLLVPLELIGSVAMFRVQRTVFAIRTVLLPVKIAVERTYSLQRRRCGRW